MKLENESNVISPVFHISISSKIIDKYFINFFYQSSI